jgi:hypothetical protein
MKKMLFVFIYIYAVNSKNVQKVNCLLVCLIFGQEMKQLKPVVLTNFVCFANAEVLNIAVWFVKIFK